MWRDTVQSGAERRSLSDFAAFSVFCEVGSGSAVFALVSMLLRPKSAPTPRFAVGDLVRLVAVRGYPPEGFETTHGSDVCVMEIPVNSIGVVVNSPISVYDWVIPGQDIMTWVLVCGCLLEVPNPHIRRLK